MNNPETHSLEQGDPVQPTKATKKPQTYSLKIGDSVLPTKATKKTDTLKIEGDPVQRTKATKKPQTHSLKHECNPVQPIKETEKTKRDTHTQAKDESKMNTPTLPV